MVWIGEMGASASLGKMILAEGLGVSPCLVFSEELGLLACLCRVVLLGGLRMSPSLWDVFSGKLGMSLPALVKWFGLEELGVAACLGKIVLLGELRISLLIGWFFVGNWECQPARTDGFC